MAVEQSSGASPASPYESPFTAMVVGLSLGSFLAGLATLQTLAFFWVNKRDPKGHKVFVFVAWLLSLLQISFHAEATWYCVVHQPARDVVFVSWPFRVQIFMVIIVASWTKLLYVARIWRLAKIRRKPPIIAIVLGLLLLAELGFGLLAGYDMYLVNNLAGLALLQRKWAAFVAVSLVTLDDVLIVVGLVYSFVMTNTNLSWTDSSMVMFCAYALNTGFIAAVFSVVSLVAFALDSVSPVFFVVVVLLPQVYTNCFLAMMNARFYFQTPGHLPDVFLPTGREMMVSNQLLGSRLSVNSTSAQPLTINDAGLPICTPTEQPNLVQRPEMPLEVLVVTRKEESSSSRTFWAV